MRNASHNRKPDVAFHLALIRLRIVPCEKMGISKLLIWAEPLNWKHITHRDAFTSSAHKHYSAAAESEKDRAV